MDRQSPEQHLYTLLVNSDISVSAAESCTGGLLTYRMTSVPGSSAYVLGSIVAYSNEMKRNVLGVRPETLESYGAVSGECAREMAAGARRVTGSTISVSTTGIAGPGGATTRKPVGLIYFACATPDDITVHSVEWHGDRRQHMEDAATFALQLVIDAANKLLNR
jgi:PncC family amidohydrolase